MMCLCNLLCSSSWELFSFLYQISALQLTYRSVDAEEIITACVLPEGNLSNGYHCTNSTFSLMPSKMPIADCREICTMYSILTHSPRECREKRALGKILFFFERNPATSREYFEKFRFISRSTIVQIPTASVAHERAIIKSTKPQK